MFGNGKWMHVILVKILLTNGLTGLPGMASVLPVAPDFKLASRVIHSFDKILVASIGHDGQLRYGQF